MFTDGVTLSACRRRTARRASRVLFVAVTLLFLLTLTSCGGSTAGSGTSDSDTTSGAPLAQSALALSAFDPAAAQGSADAAIDASHLEEGYVAASATSQTRLKLEVANGEASYYYDLPSDGTPIVAPLNMGDGTYSFTIWENSSGNRYAYVFSVDDCAVAMIDENQPFIRPNVFCDYNESSQSTTLANELCADAENQGEALRRIYAWIADNISYDEQKAASVIDATGYIPSPDATIASGTGICFDYASLASAMLRSQGIPCKIVTGTVSPDNIYHAWNMVYIDGTWVSAHISVDQNTWTRIDLTFVASGGSDYVGDGTTYTDRYTY